MKRMAHLCCTRVVLIVCALFLGSAAIAQDHHFTIWVNSFIPSDASSSRPIPNSTGGKRMISIRDFQVDKLIGCFDTDQRVHSNQFNASFRVRVAVTATEDIDSERLFGNCGETIKRDCNTGKVTGRRQCNANKVTERRYRRISQQVHEYKLVATAGNPFVPLSNQFGPIRFNVTIREEWLDGQVRFTLSGRVGDFPAFAGYVTFDGRTKTLFKIDPAPGAGPMSLVKRLTRNVTGQATFPTR